MSAKSGRGTKIYKNADIIYDTDEGYSIALKVDSHGDVYHSETPTSINTNIYKNGTLLYSLPYYTNSLELME